MSADNDPANAVTTAPEETAPDTTGADSYPQVTPEAPPAPASPESPPSAAVVEPPTETAAPAESEAVPVEEPAPEPHPSLIGEQWDAIKAWVRAELLHAQMGRSQETREVINP